VGNDETIRVALVGTTGYAGQVLHALLMHHPCISPVVLQTREPSAAAMDACRDCRAVLLATPEEASRAWVAAVREHGLRALDLSGAHRLDDDVHYGIPELWGAPDPEVRVVANPGCYPTATLLALRPLLQGEVIEPDRISVVGCSGTSGAGKGLRDDLHFSELYGNFFPYKVGEHRHTPEIERYLGTEVNFVTQLLPVVRGLMVTAFVAPRVDPEEIASTLRTTYEAHPYVTILPDPGVGLAIRHVVGTHQAVLAVGPTTRSGLVPVFCSIDNLMRGAASQAVHNLNLWMGLSPFAGLPEPMDAPPTGVPGMTRMLP
jgi:N-acetyl-gamma-glutamyl-phosphate reductase